MKLSIALRVYPQISKVPYIYPDNKLDLFECSCRSMLSGLKGVDFELHVILDSCPVEYEAMLKKVFSGERLILYKVENMGNMGTYKKQIEILSNQSYGNYVYFDENDYLYKEGTFSKMMKLLDSKIADFVTPYDHPDYDNLSLHSYAQKRVEIEGAVWRRVGSTCLTFMTSKETLLEARESLLSYSYGNTDASMWFGLTKLGVFNPRIFLRTAFSSSFYLRIYYQLLKFSFLNLVFGKRYRLLSPIPSFGTHLEKEFLATGVDWDSVAKINKPEKSL
jgi:hypothetical protein